MAQGNSPGKTCPSTDGTTSPAPADAVLGTEKDAAKGLGGGKGSGNGGGVKPQDGDRPPQTNR